MSNDGANAPVTWVGFYIALASLVCCFLMAADLFSGIRQRKFHFPPRYFSLNSATLAVLAIATKLPADLTTSMPGRYDQLSKLSGTALLCTAIANFMPSLIDMSGSEVTSNTIAVAILVVTVVADVSIQMGTGVVHKFLPEHVVLLVLLLVLLAILCSAAVCAGPTKKLAQRYYNRNSRPCEGNPAVDSVRESLKLFWVTARFFNHRYLFCYSEFCTAAGALSLVVVGGFIEAAVRSTRNSFSKGEHSDYRWSTTAVLFVQAVTVCVGAIAPASRWLSAVRLSPNLETQKTRDLLFPTDVVWAQTLIEWDESPLPYIDRSPILQIILLIPYLLKFLILIPLLKLLHLLTTSACYFIRYVSIASGRTWERALKKKEKRNNNIPVVMKKLEDDDDDKTDYEVTSKGHIVLVAKNLSRLPEELNGWIDKGTRRPFSQLMGLLEEHSTARNGFTNAGRFDRGGQLLPGFDLPASSACWGLPIVTLAAIAAALPGLDRDLQGIKSLLNGVGQGLRYVNAVDKYRPGNRGQSSLSIRKATERVWTDLHRRQHWLKENLDNFRVLENGRSALERWKTTARDGVDEAISGTTLDRMLNEGEIHRMDQDSLMCIYMYRLSNTILDDCGNATSSGELFALLRTMIADNMAACLTNLPAAIYNRCTTGAIEDREWNVSQAALLLGEVGKILNFLQAEEFARFYPQRRECVGEWRSRRQDHPSTSSNVTH